MATARKQNPSNEYFRSVIIRNFRNIGINGDTGIVINRSLLLDELGNVVILVGQNNSGKSNVLDAIMAASTGRISDDDIPDQSLVHRNLVPSVSILIQNGGERYNGRKQSSTKRSAVRNDGSGTAFDTVRLGDDERFVEMTRTILAKMSATGGSIGSRARALAEGSALSDAALSFIYSNNDFGTIRGMTSSEGAAYYFDCLLRNCSRLGPMRPSYKEVGQCGTNAVSDDEKRFQETYGYPLIPNVIKYEEEPISESELTSAYKSMNRFARRVLDLTGQFTNALTAHRSLMNGGDDVGLKDVEKRINKELVLVSDDFNGIYKSADFPYRFEMRLDRDAVRFRIMLSDIEVHLDRQSVGFRWFFDFYFNLIASRILNPGDVVILDEPATNLHVGGQNELKGFLRTYSRKLSVTFIISTHSPFFIDCDHLDEVRIVRRIEDGTSVVDDRFSMVDYRNPDQLDLILKSLTIGRNILIDSNDVCVFVEGITDYNYLVAFKILLGIDHVCFLPINGLGVNDGQRELILGKLLSVSRHPNLLVDGDIAGMQFKEKSEGRGCTVVMLTEIDPGFKDIECLFEGDELSKFDLSSKSWNRASVFKNEIEYYSDEISGPTKENFRKVIEYLIENCRP